MYKILQVNVTVNWGSTGRIVEEIGQTIIENGGDSHIAYSRGKSSYSSSNLIHIGNKMDIYSHVLQTRFLDRNGLASKRATIKLIKLIKDLNPDIIHLHNIHGYYVNYLLFFQFLRNSKIPVVWTLHDCWAFTGHCAYFSFVNCMKWEKQCNKCIQLKKYPQSWFIDRSRKNYVDKMHSFSSLDNLILIPVSNWLSDLLRTSFLKSYPMEVIHNGINIENFKIQSDNFDMRKRMNLEKKTIILGVANIWENRKGLNDFFKLRKILPDDYSIILVGVTSKQIRDLPKGVIGVLRTNSIKELVDFYSLADIYVNPTWEDNFPTTNLEALACGTPVITYRTGGSIEAIDEKTGFIVEQGNVVGISHAIEIIKNRGVDFYAEPCRSRAVTFFDKEKCYKKYIQLYSKILHKKHVDI